MNSSSNISGSYSVGQNNNINLDDDFVDFSLDDDSMLDEAEQNSVKPSLIPKALKTISEANKNPVAMGDNSAVSDDEDFGFMLSFESYNPKSSSSFDYDSMTYKAEHNHNESSSIPKALETISMTNNNNSTIGQTSASRSTTTEYSQTQEAQVQKLINQPFKIPFDMAYFVPFSLCSPSDHLPKDNDPFMNFCDEIIGEYKDYILGSILEPCFVGNTSQPDPPRLLPDDCSLQEGLNFIKMTRTLREMNIVEVDLTSQLGLDDRLVKLTYDPRITPPLSNQQLREIETEFTSMFSWNVTGYFQRRAVRDTHLLLFYMASLVTSRLGCAVPADPTALHRFLLNTCFETNSRRLTAEAARFLLSEYYTKAQARQYPEAKRALPQWKRAAYDTSVSNNN